MNFGQIFMVLRVVGWTAEINFKLKKFEFHCCLSSSALRNSEMYLNLSIYFSRTSSVVSNIYGTTFYLHPKVDFFTTTLEMFQEIENKNAVFLFNLTEC